MESFVLGTKIKIKMNSKYWRLMKINKIGMKR
jgi:hypothetical protein